MPISEASLGIITCIFAIYVDLILMRWPNAGTINWNSSFIRFRRCWELGKWGVSQSQRTPSLIKAH